MWFEWVENIPYFPTVLAFCAATFAYVIDPRATRVYVGAMLFGIVITSAPPFIVEKIKKRSWVMSNPDPVLVDADRSSPGPA